MDVLDLMLHGYVDLRYGGWLSSSLVSLWRRNSEKQNIKAYC
jgi:hypothetical protein